MLRPVEIQQRLNPSEYLNRVQKPEHGHGTNSRDFAYEIEEANREGHHGHQPPSQEFGEDTYEPSAEEKEPTPEPEEPKPARDGENQLDITA